MKTFKLRLTANERKEIDGVSFRHWSGFDLRSVLLRDTERHAEIGWRTEEEIEFEVKEHDALDIVSMARETQYFVPRLSIELANKITAWVYAVEIFMSGENN